MFGIQSKQEKIKKSHLTNLISLMAIDGHIDDREKAILAFIAQRLGVQADTLKKMIAQPQKAKFVIPKDENQRLTQLVDLVFMMMVDGEVDEREMDYCVTAAVKMGFSPAKVREIVGAIIDGVKHRSKKPIIIQKIRIILQAEPVQPTPAVDPPATANP